ncbi:MAG: polysaccharide biosynthesis protein [Syntrophomonadaceae bacterium]|jgi:FlaA1/EpsC-like NDP-sugar epimerase|nr:polysaccharide biosynthesis protein [Syntrophomonadaceae bacterium]
MSYLHNKKFLITGGTGSVGQVLTARLLESGAETVRILSRDEYKQYRMEQKFSESRRRLRFLLGDVRDKERLQRATEGIDYVFHLAALKHVPACEYNPYEAVKTNVLGTQNIIEASIEQGVRAVLYTSSDKAAGPTNTMGASKLLAERLIIAANETKGPREIKFLSVRFGNVLNSSGSVIPLFKRQIRRGGPVTVTNPNMTRFFMSAERAVDLILEALSHSEGGECYVLKMPVLSIGVLAESIIKMSALDIPVKEIGLRPGEKMFEELMSGEESERTLETPSMFIVLPFYRSVEQGLKLYKNAKKTEAGVYSSQLETPLTPEQTIDLLKPLVHFKKREV